VIRTLRRDVPRALTLILITGCAVHALPLPPDHPASAGAPVGWTTGAPASLRPGVVVYGEASSEPAGPAKPAEPAHHHHH